MLTALIILAVFMLASGIWYASLPYCPKCKSREVESWEEVRHEWERNVYECRECHYVFSEVEMT